jgi:L-lactate permease
MSLTFGDLGPALVGIIAGVVGLALVWHAVRQAHGPDRRRRKEEPQAGE